jgi:hypothetical protein
MNPLSTQSSRSRIPAAIHLGVVAMLSSFVPAQLPEHTAVVGTASFLSPSPGQTGVFTVSLPTSTSPGGKITALAPLPKQLTRASGVNTFGGAFSVLYRPADGVLFVGDGGLSGEWCHVHILKVAGNIVLSSRTVRIGQVTKAPRNGRLISGMSLLPDGRVAIVGGPFVAGPMQSSTVAILDDRPSTPKVTPVRLSAQLPGPYPWGIATTPDGKTAYVVTHPSMFTPFPGRLFAIDLTRSTSVTPVLLHTWSRRLVPQLRMGSDGVIYATAFDPSVKNPPTPSIEQIRVTGTSAVVKSIPVSSKTAIVGPALESATGRYVFASTDFNSHVNKNSVLMGDRQGKVTVLAGPPKSGWGVPYAIDIHNAFQTYGTGSSGANSYSIAEFPNAGGLPEVGNSKFSLTVRATPGAPRRSLLVLGLKPADRQLLGIRLLVDLSQPYLLFPLSAASSAVVPLPIPNSAAVRGARIYAQSAHADAGSSLATSNGVSITVR